jgi:hypothetical protein
MLEFLSNYPQIHRGHHGVSLAGAVHAMLADEHERIRHSIQ